MDEAILDPRVSPCQDFYRYACGQWLERTEIPADRDRYSRGFIAVVERNEGVLKEILEQAAAGALPPDTVAAQQLGDYYASCTDEAGLERSSEALRAELKRLSGASPQALAATLARMHLRGIPVLFSITSTQDFKDSTRVIAALDQGGIGLPDRDYYLKDDAKTKAVRSAYVAFATNVMKLLGDAPEVAKRGAETVLALETRLAKASLSRVERRDPNKIYHRFDRAGLKTKAPAFPWDDYFKAMGLPSLRTLNVVAPEFFAEVDQLVRTTRPEAWKIYLRWAFARAVIPALSKGFRDEEFRYQSVAISGASQEVPRWKQCVAFADEDLGEALGRVFVERTFGAEGKARTLAVVDQVKQAFASNLASLSWMDEATKKMALAKLEKMGRKIGFPDRWRDYSSLKLTRESFLANTLRGNELNVRRDLAKIDKPVDRDEWLMTPQTVNAYNEPLKNEIVFPAGILQAPFFSRSATEPVNFGAMGMIVGHEVTHGFDDEGRQFDATGNLVDWWSDASAKRFLSGADCVRAQYDGYKAIDEVHVNGSLTLGENVADLGGLKLAHLALLRWLDANPDEKAKAEQYRFTPSQQFFLGFAQSWCSKYRPETARVRAATDPHSPPEHRVNGPLRNLAAFQEAFACKAGDPMVLSGPKRCEVW